MLAQTNLHPEVKQQERLARRVSPLNRSAWLGNDQTNAVHKYGEFNTNRMTPVIGNSARPVWSLHEIERARVSHILAKHGVTSR